MVDTVNEPDIIVNTTDGTQSAALVNDLKRAANELIAQMGSPIPPQDQAVWNTGTDTTESSISPSKLDAKIEDSVPSQATGVWEAGTDTTPSKPSAKDVADAISAQGGGGGGTWTGVSFGTVTASALQFHNLFVNMQGSLIDLPSRKFRVIFMLRNVGVSALVSTWTKGAIPINSSSSSGTVEKMQLSNASVTVTGHTSYSTAIQTVGTFVDQMAGEIIITVPEYKVADSTNVPIMFKSETTAGISSSMFAGRASLGAARFTFVDGFELTGTAGSVWEYTLEEWSKT